MAGPTSFTTQGGTTLTADQIRQFLATNPSDQQILQTAAQNGMSMGDIGQALNSQNMLFNNGNPTSVQMNDPSNGSIYNRLNNEVAQNSLGYSLNQGNSGGYNPNAQITSTNGNGSSNLGFGSGSSGGGSGYNAPNANTPGPTGGAINPYLDSMAQGITQQVTDNYNRNIAPQDRSGAMVAGGFGGSREGVVDANATNDMNRGLGANLANLYGTGWQNAQQNNLQQQGLNNNYALGMANNNLGFSTLDSNNAQFGANLALNTANAQNNWATNGVAAGNQMQNTPINYFNQFSNNTNTAAGQGGTNTNTTQMPGNAGLGALGGIRLISSLMG